jgi:hypothetical protein
MKGCENARTSFIKVCKRLLFFLPIEQLNVSKQQFFGFVSTEQYNKKYASIIWLCITKHYNRIKPKCVSKTSQKSLKKTEQTKKKVWEHSKKKVFGIKKNCKKNFQCQKKF